jgi:hypothetical protein
MDGWIFDLIVSSAASNPRRESIGKISHPCSQQVHTGGWTASTRMAGVRAGGHATHYTDVTQIGDAYAALSKHILKTGRLLALDRPA